MNMLNKPEELNMAHNELCIKLANFAKSIGSGNVSNAREILYKAIHETHAAIDRATPPSFMIDE